MKDRTLLIIGGAVLVVGMVYLLFESSASAGITGTENYIGEGLGKAAEVIGIVAGVGIIALFL